MMISELMQAMADAGAPMEAILIAVRALEERDAALEQKRSVERDRKRRQRERERDADGTVTGQSLDSHGDVPSQPPLSRPPNENISNPPTHTPEKQTPARKGRRLPVDWQPGPLTGDVGSAVECWPPGALDRELARFRDWAASASGPNAIKSDWQAAWRNWIRKAHDEGRHGRNRTKPNGADRDEIQNPYVRAAIARQNRSAAAVG